MWYVYAIKSEVNGHIYVGITNDIERRLKEHNSGKTRSTKAYIPWLLIYSEYVGENTILARQKEKFYKSGIGKEKLKQMAS